MNLTRICIFDTDSIRSRAISDVLVSASYNVVLLNKESDLFNRVFEDNFDIILFDTEAIAELSEFVLKLKKYAPNSGILAILNGQYSDYQFRLAELGITAYLETPISSTDEILNMVRSLELKTISEENKVSIVREVLNYAREKASDDKRITVLVNKLLYIFSDTEQDYGKIKGNLGVILFHDLLAVLLPLYKEGVLELVNNDERAVLVIKNQTVLSCFVKPGIRGIKAFLRIATWEKAHFSFKNKINISYSMESDVSHYDIEELCYKAKRAWDWFVRIKNNLPPKELKLIVNAGISNKKIKISDIEFDVLTTVVEHNLVSDIINYNSNSDIDVYTALIELRKKGILKLGAL